MGRLGKLQLSNFFLCFIGKSNSMTNKYTYRVFDNKIQKAYCSDQKASLEVKTGGNISLSLVQLLTKIYIKLRKEYIKFLDDLVIFF